MLIKFNSYIKESNSLYTQFNSFSHFIGSCNLYDIINYVENGGDINQRDKNGNTLLENSFKATNEAEIDYLLANGVDITIKNNHGENILNWAAGLMDRSPFSNWLSYVIKYILDNYSTEFILEHFPDQLDYFTEDQYVTKEQKEKHKGLFRSRSTGLWDYKQFNESKKLTIEEIADKFISYTQDPEFISKDKEICENSFCLYYFLDEFKPLYKTIYHLFTTINYLLSLTSGIVQYKECRKIIKDKIVKQFWDIINNDISLYNTFNEYINGVLYYHSAANLDTFEFFVDIINNAPDWVKRSQKSGLLDLNINEHKKSKFKLSEIDATDAAKVGEIDIIKDYLNGEGDIEACDHRGNTMLLLASFNGNFEIVKFLVDNGADILAKNKVGDTPLRDAYIQRNNMGEGSIFIGKKILNYLIINVLGQLEDDPDTISEIENYIPDEIKKQFPKIFRARDIGLWGFKK